MVAPQLIKITSKNFSQLRDQDYFEDRDMGTAGIGFIDGTPGTHYLAVVYAQGVKHSCSGYSPSVLDEMNLYSTFSSEWPVAAQTANGVADVNKFQPRSETLWNLTPDTPKIDYRFGESGYIDELKAYIDATYGAHYSGKVGPIDIMISGGQALGFIVGSIIKYAFRLGKKDNYKRDDVLKIAHYAILLLHTYDVLKLGDKKNG